MDGLYGAATKGAKIDGKIGPVPFSIDVDTGVPAKDAKGTLFFNQEQWRKGWEALAKRQKKAYDDAMRDCDTPYVYVCGAEATKKSKFYTPRPAMGYKGPLGDQYDSHIQHLIDIKKIDIIDQKQWLFDHSGMRIPTTALFTNIIQDRIIAEIKKTGGGFGKY